MKEPARSIGGAELSVYLAMIDVQKKLKELDAKMSVLWQKHILDQGEAK